MDGCPIRVYRQPSYQTHHIRLVSVGQKASVLSISRCQLEEFNNISKAPQPGPWRAYIMGKKRKAGVKPLGHPGPREIDEADAKLRINNYEDVADSEDEFHINRDKILLGEDSHQGKRRRLQEEGE